MKEILQRIDLRGYEAATEQRCPVCGTEAVLTIRGSQSISCRKCAFVGDIIHLYARAKRVDLPAAVAELRHSDLLSFSNDIEGSIYFRDAEDQSKLQRVWAAAQSTFGDSTSTPRAFLGNHHCWYTMDATVKAARYHGFMQIGAFDDVGFDLPKEAKEAKAWLRNYGAVCVPVYAGWKIVGFYLLRLHKEDDLGVTPGEFYLPVLTSEAPGVAYAHAVPIGTPEVFVVDSALTALRYNMRQIFDGALETPFLVPAAGFHLNLDCIGESAPIFFTATLEPRWFHRATETAAARTVLYTSYADLGFTPTVTLSRQNAGITAARTVISALRNRARPSHEAYAKLLLSKKPTEARAIVAAYPLSPIGQSRCFQACSGDDAAALTRIFERTTTVRSVDIDAKTVVEREEGWFCGDTLITDTTFQITEIVAGGTETVARGSVRFRRVGIPFECSYDEIRKNTRKWLEDIVLSQPGQGVATVSSSWGSRLFRIATSFQEPRRVVKGVSYGWGDEGRALFMPYFTLRADGLLGTEHAAPGGAMLPRPTPLTAMEWGAVQDPYACQIFLALLGNLLRTQAGLPGVGIAVRSSPHVVETVASALHLDIVRDPRPDALERGALNPLPTPTVWTDDGLAEAFNAGVPMHILMSVDPGSHRLLRLQRNWLCLDVTDFSWGDSIRMIFLVLRELLWVRGPEVIHLETERLYLDLAARLHVLLAARGIDGDAFLAAARDIGKTISHTGNAGFTLLLTLCWAQERGLLTSAPRDGLQIFQVADVRAALANPLTPRADIEMLAKQLLAARYLALDRGGEWGIPLEIWNVAQGNYVSK
jgi:hypothetical protein